jgi:hypothetical protein
MGKHNIPRLRAALERRGEIIRGRIQGGGYET